MNFQNDDDWLTLLQMLPKGWEVAMQDTGLLQRKRNFKSEADLLRTLLMYLSNDSSLVVTSAFANTAGIADISDVGLLKRLRNSADFFEWMNIQFLKNRGVDYSPLSVVGNYNVYAVDASVVSEPGSTGTDWRLHYSFDIRSLKCHEYKLTRKDVGETFLNFQVKPTDLFVADRAYGRYKSMQYIKQNGGEFIVRYMNKAFSIEDEKGNKLNISNKVKKLKIGETLHFKANVYTKDTEKIPVRFCVLKKNPVEAENAIKKAKKEMSKKQRVLGPDTLELHRYIIVMTSLPDEISASEVLEIYRVRWQVELAFKRLKSIFGFGHLPKKDIRTARAWLQGKIFLAILTQLLIDECCHFSPWGYPTIRRE